MFGSGKDVLAGWLYRPAGTGPAPIVIMAHGFGGTRELGLAPYAERFRSAGLAVLLFDYRYFGASGGQPRQLLDIASQRADYRAAVAFARTLDGIDPDRVALFGTSFSGGHVLSVAAADPRIAAVVAQCPFTDGLATAARMRPADFVALALAGLRDQIGALAGREPRLIPAAGAPGTLAAMTSPDALPGMAALVPPGGTWRNEVAARIALRIPWSRPGRRAARISCPVLFCVCDLDVVTVPRPTLRAARAAARGEIRRYPIGHFAIYAGQWFERAVADQTAFLLRHLGPPSRKD